ncbi:MAG: mitochondrial fission ELM1 family protein [Luteolibacter sp.]|uniref:mitochondrial fission ELM1 family protein n=1 Tax=Luteolibacter sp. TaxID=1962973 RepID=UPI00326658BB
MTKPLTLWLLGDGKPGHENQSLGLADALARRVPCEVHRISLAGKRGIVTRVRAALKVSERLPKPDLIIGAGHATHFALLRLARKHRAKSIVLMRPSLPMGWFDLCIVPAHDFANGCGRENVIITQGALNRVSPPPISGRNGKMILIGGPSSSHGWDGESLLATLAEISKDGSWQLTDSRRTPDGFTDEIRRKLPAIEVFPHQQTTPEWLPGKLATAEEVWVSEDSVSMIYEALSSGARTGLLPVPRLAESSRVLRGLENLVNDGFITPFSDWEKTGRLKAPPSILREADRCADEVLRRDTTRGRQAEA